MAGNPEVMTAMSESHLLLKQIDLEAVRQDPLTLQYLLGRYKTACARMTQAAMEGVCELCSLHRGRSFISLLHGKLECVLRAHIIPSFWLPHSHYSKAQLLQAGSLVCLTVTATARSS